MEFDDQYRLDVQLEKLSTNPEGLRTNKVLGVAAHYPEVGRPFIMLGEALDKSQGANMRLICTTKVLTADRDGDVVVFTTRNSQYRATLTEKE